MPNKSLSLLRYPGGKARLFSFMQSLLKNNAFIGHSYIEPYCGGAGLALRLLAEQLVKEIHINDFDKAIYAIWNTALYNINELKEKLIKTPITIEEWKKQKQVYKNKEDSLSLGFATLFLNRCNYSGIINGGPIGGIKQEGIYKLNCRFNKQLLISKLDELQKLKKYIELNNKDALILLQEINQQKGNFILYLDPPYFNKGGYLYKNTYTYQNHKEIAKFVTQDLKHPWIVSYDNTEEIKKLYKNENKLEYILSHTAGKAKKGKEILFFSKHFKNIPSNLLTISN